MITLGTWKFHYSQKNTKRDIVSSQRLTHNWIRFFVSPTHNASIIIIIPFFSLPFFLSSNILFVRVRGFGSPPTWRKIHYFCCTCRTSHTRIWATHSLSFSHMTLHLHIYISTSSKDTHTSMSVLCSSKRHKGSYYVINISLLNHNLKYILNNL